MVKKSQLKRHLNSYTGRLVLGVLLLHLLLLPLLMGRVLDLVDHNYTAKFVDNSRADAYLLSHLVASLDDSETIYDYLGDAVLAGRIAYARLMEAATGDLVQLGSLPAAFNEDFVFGAHEDTLYQIIMPIYGEDGSEKASLYLGYDERPVMEDIHRSHSSVFIMMSIYFAVTLLFSIILSRYLAKPIQALRRAACELVRSGMQAEELRISTGLTEVNDLSHDLEDMRQQMLSQHMKLEFQAHHDDLTQLPNRILLEDRVKQAVIMAKRNQQTFAFLLLDLDKFKEVNDGLGHQAGDQLLCQVSERIRQSMHKMDILARLSGDEFAIILLDCNEAQCRKFLREVCQLIRQSFTVDKNVLHIDVSIGVAFYPTHGEAYDSLLKSADVAMYDAKHRGKGYAIYHHNMQQTSIENIVMASELRDAIKSNELVVYYQPKLNLKNNTIDCVEALVRWNHPSRGMICPDEFIPIAEKSLLINALTAYVLEKGIQQCQVWRQQGRDLCVAINLSVRNLSDKTLLSNVALFLARYTVPASSIQLEVTESMVMSDPVQAQQVLDEFLAMGLTVVMDDFGSGYTSLAQVVDLPVSVIKIDKGFVVDMVKNTSHQAVVKSVIGLSHSLGKVVTCEGVENAESLDIIRGFNGDEVQGNYICQALPVETLNVWLTGSGYGIGQG